MVSIASPHVLVFTNDMPDLSKLTADRWVMLVVDEDVPGDKTIDCNFKPQTKQPSSKCGSSATRKRRGPGPTDCARQVER